MNIIREVFSYREMIRMLVKRNLRGRYKRSLLGFAWTFISPLLQIGVYTLVFSEIFRSDIERYYLFIFVALIPFIAISGTVNDSTTCIVAEKNLVSKIYFPRQVLPIVTTLNNFVNMLLCMLVVLLVCGFSVGLNPVALICLIPLVLTEFLLALGLSFIVSSIGVYFRDLQHIISIFTMLWQFLTPIMYPLELVPEKMLIYFNLNPMTAIINAYRDILYYKTIPAFSTLLSATLMGLIFLCVGWFLFRKMERRFAEVL